MIFSKPTLKLIATFGGFVAVTVTFLDKVCAVAYVQGVSMQPTLNPNKKVTDYVLLNKLLRRSLSRGDIVTFVSPTHPDESYIKRITALEDDQVRTLRYKLRVVEVPKGHCWLEGDNHRQSEDSNTFGPVALGLIQGKATHIVWPPARWQRLNAVEAPPKRFEFKANLAAQN